MAESPRGRGESGPAAQRLTGTLSGPHPKGRGAPSRSVRALSPMVRRPFGGSSEGWLHWASVEG
eukprot:4450738-Alexandrium_andersonii.AAC.1